MTRTSPIISRVNVYRFNGFENSRANYRNWNIRFGVHCKANRARLGQTVHLEKYYSRLPPLTNIICLTPANISRGKQLLKCRLGNALTSSQRIPAINKESCVSKRGKKYIRRIEYKIQPAGTNACGWLIWSLYKHTGLETWYTYKFTVRYRIVRMNGTEFLFQRLNSISRRILQWATLIRPRNLTRLGYRRLIMYSMHV